MFKEVSVARVKSSVTGPSSKSVAVVIMYFQDYNLYFGDTYKTNQISVLIHTYSNLGPKGLVLRGTSGDEKLIKV